MRQRKQGGQSNVVLAVVIHLVKKGKPTYNKHLGCVNREGVKRDATQQQKRHTDGRICVKFDYYFL